MAVDTWQEECRLAALPLAYGHVLMQRCWTHKTRNVLNYVKRADQESVKRSLHRISHARNLREAQKAAQRFVARWQRFYPKAVNCLQKDLPELLAFLQIKTNSLHRSYVPPMRLNDDSWRRAEEPDRWAPSVIEPVWKGFCFRSSLVRILNNGQLLHFFC